MATLAGRGAPPATGAAVGAGSRTGSALSGAPCGSCNKPYIRCRACGSISAGFTSTSERISWHAATSAMWTSDVMQTFSKSRTPSSERP